MILYIKPSEVFFFDVFLEDRSFFEETPFLDKANLLNDAINLLEADIVHFAKPQQDSKYYSYFWEFTYDIYRDDGIKDTVLDYYLLGIIRYINRIYSIKKIEIHYFLSNPILEKIEKIAPLELKFSKIYHLKEYLRFQLGPLKYIKNYLGHVLNFTNKKRRLSGNNNVFFFTNNNFNTVRLKEFPNLIQKKFNVSLINFSLTKSRNYHNQKESNIKSYSLNVFFKSLFDTINIYKSIKKYNKKYQPKTLFSRNFNRQSFLQTYYLVLRYNALYNLFSNNSLKFVIVNTTVGDPINRMTLSVARSCGIKTIVFSCRSALSYLRAEDRVIALDFNESNGNFFTDYFISFDKLSKQLLERSGVQKKQIFTYSESNNEKILNYVNDGILILFASTMFNEKILNLFEIALENGYSFKKVYYREHPNKGISKGHMQRFRNLFNKPKCINEFAWNELKFNNVLAFTSNSTSGIEASARGASMVWLPFLTEQSTQFKPMIDAIGKTCYDKNEFYDFLRDIETRTTRLNFNKKCSIQYKQNIKEESTMKQLYNIL